MDNIFQHLSTGAECACSFALLGGECDEFMRFLQLEWESFSDEESKKELSERFYKCLNQYKEYREIKRDWRSDFGERDSSKLIV